MILGNLFPSLYQSSKPIFPSHPRLEQKGLLGILLDGLFGPKKPDRQIRDIRKAAQRQPGRFVDPTTGEIIEHPRKVIIGWIDRETGEITPNPEASRIAKQKGVMK